MSEIKYINLDTAYDIDTLEDWYINSVSQDDVPVWTEEHLEELLNDFYVIPKDTHTADVVPVKHGHWDNISESCSVCGSHWAEGMVMNADDWGYFDPMPAYCPYCGAKMDGGGDKE